MLFNQVDTQQSEPPDRGHCGRRYPRGLLGATGGSSEAAAGVQKLDKSRARKSSNEGGGGARARAFCIAGPPSGVLLGPSWSPFGLFGLSRGIVGQSWNYVARRDDFRPFGDILEAIVGRIGALEFLDK